MEGWKNKSCLKEYGNGGNCKLYYELFSLVRDRFTCRTLSFCVAKGLIFQIS